MESVGKLYVVPSTILDLNNEKLRPVNSLARRVRPGNPFLFHSALSIKLDLEEMGGVW